MVKSTYPDLDFIFHALSDQTRRIILERVSKQERTIQDLAQPFKISLAAISKHLKVLEKASLIQRRKEGSFYFIRLNPTSLVTAEAWIKTYTAFWDDRLNHLKKILEERN